MSGHTTWRVEARFEPGVDSVLVHAPSEEAAVRLGACLLDMPASDVRVAPAVDFDPTVEPVLTLVELRQRPGVAHLVLQLSPDDVRWLQAILDVSPHAGATTPAELVEHLVRSAADGARRRGSWERQWLAQAVPLEAEPGIPDPTLPRLYRALPPVDGSTP